MEDEDIADIFGKLDVEMAIDDCNFNKAVRVDWFSGKTIKRNPIETKDGECDTEMA